MTRLDKDGASPGRLVEPANLVREKRLVRREHRLGHVAGSHVMGWVCLGRRAAALIEAGDMDPVAAYWNTVFRGEPGLQALKMKKNMSARRAVASGLGAPPFFYA